MSFSKNKSSFNKSFMENYRERRDATILMIENRYLNYLIKPLFFIIAIYSISFLFFAISYNLRLEKTYIYLSGIVALSSSLLIIGISIGILIIAKALKN